MTQQNPVDVIARETCRQYQSDFPCDAKDGSCAGCRNGAEAILTALEASGCPVVPAEDLTQMNVAGRDASGIAPVVLSRAYRAMVKAAAGWWRKEV